MARVFSQTPLVRLLLILLSFTSFIAFSVGTTRDGYPDVPLSVGATKDEYVDQTVILRYNTKGYLHYSPFLRGKGLPGNQLVIPAYLGISKQITFKIVGRSNELIDVIFDKSLDAQATERGNGTTTYMLKPSKQDTTYCIIRCTEPSGQTFPVSQYGKVNVEPPPAPIGQGRPRPQ